MGQIDDQGREVIVACISRSLNKHEANYSSFEGEMLAAVWAVKTFGPYVLGLNFNVVTDHSPLQWLINKPDLTGKHARWALSFFFNSLTRPTFEGCYRETSPVISPVGLRCWTLLDMFIRILR